MSVLTFGETMALMRATDIGPLAHADTLRLGIGGAESNVAIALRRLGTDVSWAGRVGTDSLGELIERELRAEGVSVHAVRDPDAPSGLMIKERRTVEATRVWYHRKGSAGSRLVPSDIADPMLDGLDLVHCTGITPALSESARATVFDVVHRARARGVRVSFDLNYRASLWSQATARDTYRDLIPLVDIVFGGDEELALAVGERDDPHALARAVAELGPSEVVVKLGADGAVSLVDGAPLTVPAVPVTVVDTVGAGDAFVAGYLAETLLGEPPARRLATAAAVGAFACTVAGDWEGMPRRSELGLLSATEPVAR